MIIILYRILVKADSGLWQPPAASMRSIRPCRRNMSRSTDSLRYLKIKWLTKRNNANNFQRHHFIKTTYNVENIGKQNMMCLLLHFKRENDQRSTIVWGKKIPTMREKQHQKLLFILTKKKENWGRGIEAF